MADSTLRVKVIPEIDEEALLGAVLAVISGHAVVKPGETLIIRLKDCPAEEVYDYQNYLNSQGLPFGVLVVVGDEIAVAEQEPRVRLEVTGSGEWPAAATVTRAFQGQDPASGITVR